MKQTLKIIGSVICCALCLAVIGLFVYIVCITEPAADPEQYQISNYAILNLSYRYLTSGIDLNILIPVVGLIALLLEIVCASPLKFLFSKLPLGLISESDKPMTVKERIIPSLLIGVAAAVNTTFDAVSPEKFAQNAVWINWVIFAVIALSLLVLLCKLLPQGGIWNVLVSGSLLIIANLGIGMIFGAIISALSILLAGLAMGFGVILFCIVVFFILSIVPANTS